MMKVLFGYGKAFGTANFHSIIHLVIGYDDAKTSYG
jgi:hypothetical protein